MLDKWLYKIFEGIDNIIFYVDNWCNERYKNVGNFFNKKRKRRKTKKVCLEVLKKKLKQAQMEHKIT